jgi:NADH-quinone oxidoreductase subunit F
MDEDNCIVEVRASSCSSSRTSRVQVLACREGTKQMLALLQKIVDGKATIGGSGLLERWPTSLKDASLCGLGKTVANPVLSTMRYFRDEYIAHVRDRHCPAHVCQAFRTYYINPDKCKGCSRCAKVCPVGAISGTVKQPYVIDQAVCVRCGACKDTCRFDAVEER